MVIWKGAGVYGTTALVDAVFGDGHYKDNGWPKILMGLIGGTVTSGVGLILNRGKLATDPQTGQQLRIKGHHDLFFIPMQYWGPLILAFAIFASFR